MDPGSAPDRHSHVGLTARASEASARIGFGTYGFSGDECREAVASALDAGYRLFDCAEIYGNEREVGDAFARTGIARDELFVISKFWFTHNSPAALRQALDSSLGALQLETLDLYMLHWPSDGMDLPRLFDALLEEKAKGRIRQIGLCNFPHKWLRPLLEEERPIHAVELEWHVYLDQGRTHQMLLEQGIPFIAYCPLAQGRVANDPALQEIGKRHGVPASTIALSWLIGHEGVTAIPKATSRARQETNLAALDVELTGEERERIAALARGLRLANFPFSPPWDD